MTEPRATSSTVGHGDTQDGEAKKRSQAGGAKEWEAASPGQRVKQGDG